MTVKTPVSIRHDLCKIWRGRGTVVIPDEVQEAKPGSKITVGARNGIPVSILMRRVQIVGRRRGEEKLFELTPVYTPQAS